MRDYTENNTMKQNWQLVVYHALRFMSAVLDITVIPLEWLRDNMLYFSDVVSKNLKYGVHK